MCVNIIYIYIYIYIYIGLGSLIAALDSKKAHTSFGPLPLSTEGTKPSFSFGTGDRFNSSNKLYMSPDMAEVQARGKGSPGPIYNVPTDTKFHTNQNWVFGTDKRVTLGIKDPEGTEGAYECVFDDPLLADKKTKERILATKFGTASRMPFDKKEKTPGPQYFPGQKPEVKKPPSYSLGAKRELKGESPLVLCISTPNAIGPARYMPEHSAYTSQNKNSVKNSFTKDIRKPLFRKTFDKNQTYETRGSVGTQIDSRKKSEGKCTFGTSGRGNPKAHVGMFRSEMEKAQPTLKAVIPHPQIK